MNRKLLLSLAVSAALASLAGVTHAQDEAKPEQPQIISYSQLPPVVAEGEDKGDSKADLIA